MEQRLHIRLQIRPHNCLGDSVGDSGHPERPHALALLRYLDRTNRRRKYVPRTSDSRACRGSLSGPSRTPRSTRRRRPPLPDGLDFLVGLPDNLL